MTCKTFKGTMNDRLIFLVCLVWLKTKEQFLSSSPGFRRQGTGIVLYIRVLYFIKTEIDGTT